MTDIRKCAQAVIDNYELRHKFDMDVLINDLRQALDEPVEPVASCQAILDSSQPSVDALIAEIDRLRRHGDDNYIYGFDIDSILDKYRSNK